MQQTLYQERLKNTQISNIVPYWKRMFSGLLDYLIVCCFYWIMLSMTQHFSHLRILTMLFCVLYHYFFYLKVGRTIGNLVMKIKPIFISELTDKKKAFLNKSLFITVIFIPNHNLIYLIGVGFFVILGTYLNKKYLAPGKKLLVWDVIAEMVYVEVK